MWFSHSRTLAVLVVVLASCVATSECLRQHSHLARGLHSKRNTNRAKNIILFIGDGMGITTVSAARIFQGQQQGRSGEDFVLSFEKFPSVGLAKTYCYNRQVPDSASTATAIMSGVKVKFYTVGLSPEADYSCDPTLDPERHLPNLASWAQQAGKSTGLVTTTRVTHATPAAVYAHTNNRNWECDGSIPAPFRGCVKDIGLQIVEGEVGRNLRVVLGGGRRQLGATSEPDPESCARTDGRNLVNEWLAGKDNALYVNSSDSLMAADLSQVDHLLGLFSPGHMPFVAERGPEHPSLGQMTTQAIKVLQKNNHGYFLMVEAGKIDIAHHKNWARMALQETAELDETISAVLKLINLKDTLLIVTADHSHSMTFNGYPELGNDILGYASLPGAAVPYETLSYANGPAFLHHRTNSGLVHETWKAVTPEERLAPRYPHLATINLQDETHGGEDVPVYAIGPYAHLFYGVFEQNYIAQAAAYAASIGPSNLFHLFNKISTNS